MGLRERLRGGDASVERYRMREELLSIGDDYWIEDESGRRAFKVDGKAVRVRDTFVLRDASGQEAAKIQERKVNVRDTMKIERAAGAPPCTRPSWACVTASRSTLTGVLT
jgi:uncharacterized protein YxjI